MKRVATLSLVLALSASGLAFAQSGGMKDMEKKDSDMQHCMDMKGMKGMDMQNMDMQKCNEMMSSKDMKGMDMGSSGQGKSQKAMTHRATAVVKDVDPAKGTVTLAHGPVKTLNWPAMTMKFAVRDKTLLDKLAMNKDVVVDFVQQGSDYVITSVK